MLLQPLTALMAPGRATLPLQGQASNHGQKADDLEAFARPCLLAAHWLASAPHAAEALNRDQTATWFRHGLLLGTNPASKEYWGPTANHHQHTVEMCALTLCFQIAPKWLWQPLDKREKEQILTWLATIRGAGLHRNNHVFFNIMTLAFLEQEGHGRAADRSTSRYLLDLLEGMAMGGGWFIDGMNETVDYYNAYAFHYYGLWWSKLYGHHDPRRSARWKEWAAAFLKDYLHFFAASGENPPFGRSICYRFAATAPFALAEFAGISALPPGQARNACSKNLDFFLKHPIGQAQHALSLGWTDEFPTIAEAYSCAGSTYWAAKGFAPLLLPSAHKFWTEKSELLPAERNNFVRAISSASLVVRSHDGDVEVLNNGNGICVANTKFGVWKWGKLSYRTGFGFETSPDENKYPLDAALTAEFSNGSVMGRHQCQPIEVTASHCGSAYGLGDRFSQNHIGVETRIWFKEGWHLQWHRVAACNEATLRLGTYSLPVEGPDKLKVSISENFAWLDNGNRIVAIQSLKSFDRIAQHSSDPQKRSHLLSRQSALLTAERKIAVGTHDLLALTWAGRSGGPVLPWKLLHSKIGELTLEHPSAGIWKISNDALPSFAI